jgi:hypothetical protein
VEPGADAVTVVAVIYDRGTTPTINHDLARGLGWDLTRLHAAYDEAERRLAAAGLRLNRTHGEASIVPTDDHSKERSAVTHAQSDSTATTVNAYGYVAAYEALTGQPILPGKKGFRRRLLLGEIANLGVIDLQARTPILTAAAVYAFLDQDAETTEPRVAAATRDSANGNC